MKKFTWVLFIIYILVVLKLTLFRTNFQYDEPQINLTLFVDLINTYKNAELWTFLRLFLGNIGWFVPFGFLLPVLLKKERFWKVAAFGFCFSFTIETLQYIFRKGVAELDDLILNTLGAVIGYFMYKLFLKLRCNILKL